MSVLAGDVGGTNTRLGFFDAAPKGLRAAVVRTFPNREYGSLAEIVREFVPAEEVVLQRIRALNTASLVFADVWRGPAG